VGNGVALLTVFILTGYLKYLRARLRNKGKLYQPIKKYESDLIEYLYAEEGEEVSFKQQQIINYLKSAPKIA
jgi:hypothetical protein